MSDERTPYRPIACDIYSEYELAIMQRRKLRLSWCAPDGELHMAMLLPLDLLTRNGEEFLIARSLDGQDLRLRLDWISHCAPLTQEVDH